VQVYNENCYKGGLPSTTDILKYFNTTNKRVVIR
jgi:hypothetical protein